MSPFLPRFAVTVAPVRVRFGESALDVIAEEVARLGCRRALILTTPAQASMAEAFARALGDQVERFFSKLKHFRAVATRYAKRDDNFLASVPLASLRIWLRTYESVA